jgi:hypothetical protein
MSTATIDGEAFTLQELFDKWSYDIDYYQREFAWSAEDVRTLVDDLIGQFEQARKDPRTRRGMRYADPYFLGPFVYHEERRGARFLVDGQQRFTTVHLIFLHLYRQAHALGRKDAEAKLDRVIRYLSNGAWRFRIDIEERRKALQYWYDGKDFQPEVGSSLSLRNLAARSDELRELLEARLEVKDLASFVEWLLTRVILVGIQAPNRDSGFRIFESMNDRGARLTPVDLLKSFLLSRVDQDEEELNRQWRAMLSQLTTTREDVGAPSRFLQAAFIAHHARMHEGSADVTTINRELHLWVRRNAVDLLHINEPIEYFTFVERLINLAKLYRTFLGASRDVDVHHGLASLYYNEINGLTNQMIFILAAVRPTDALRLAKDKAALVANFIDRWYVLRVLNDEPALPKDLDKLMPRLVPQLRKCESADDVEAFLVGELADDEDFKAILTFQSRGTNSAQVRYLLARLTAFTQAGWNEPDLSMEYLSLERPWHIEHIFADKQDRHPDITDPVEFRLLRNRIGVLGLLKGPVNMSVKDMRLVDKVKVYRSENLLLRCLHPEYRLNNKPIRLFVERHGLQSYLRPLGDNGDLKTAVAVRGELYRRLCVAIWDRTRLGFPASAPAIEPDTDVKPGQLGAGQSPRIPAPRTPAGRPTDVLKMVRAGTLPAGTHIVGVVDGADTFAQVQADGQIKLTAGDLFRKPDDAARAVTGKRCEGKPFWHIIRPNGTRVSLRQLRDEANLRTVRPGR